MMENDSKDKEEEELNSIDILYNECISAISSLTNKIKQLQQQRNSTDPLILSNYLKSGRIFEF